MNSGSSLPGEEVGRLATCEIGLEKALGLREGALAAEFPVVDHVPVGGHDGADVLGALHPPLDLEGLDSRLHQVGNVLDELEVVGREPVARLRIVGVEAPAGLGAGAAVGALAAQVAREEAEPGRADAEGAVNEDLELQVGRGSHGPDLVEGELSREHRALEAAAGQEVDALRGGDVHLRARVELESGEMLARHLRDAEVLHDDAVGPDALEVLQVLPHPIRLALLEDRVDGDVDFPGLLMADIDRGLELVEGEIRRAETRVEVSRAEVHGVRALAEGRVEGLGVARGG